MTDIAPELLESIRKTFVENVDGNAKIKSLYQLIQDGKATYADAEEYAYLVGEALSQAFGKHLSSAVLPDGRMYFNIADRVIRPLLEEDHALVSDAAAMVQTALNQNAGIGIKAKTVAVNTDRIDGIVNKVSDAENFDDVAWVLDEPVKNFSQAVVDDMLKANVDLHGRAGLHPKIIRKAEHKCCEWCSKLEGEYDYPDVPRDVYRRHERCRCTVEYDPGNGRHQNVHTKQFLQTSGESDMIEKRRVIGLRVGKTTVQDLSTHAAQRIQERNVTMDAVKDAIENPLQTSGVKYDTEGRPSITLTGRKATVSINPDTGVIATVYPTHTKTAERLLGRK